MKKIYGIAEKKDVFEFLNKRNLLLQYKKSKNKILSGNFSGVDLKIRQPTKDQICSFRINKQFRAFGKIGENGELVVFSIDNHQ